jgi:hypothetical protein
MLTRVSGHALPFIGCLLLLLLGNICYGMTGGTLTEVNVSEDLKRIVIKYTGAVGKHAAFVIERPHRLVIDFASVSIGNVRRKIDVNDKGIQQIRLGQTPARARLVVDFGENPVPTFKIQRMDRAILVMLGRGTSLPGLHTISARTKTSRRAPAPQKKSSRRISRGSEKAPVTVRKAGVADDLVYVELTHRKTPNKTYRLVVDCSLEDLLVRQASLSDSTGTLKRFEVEEKSKNDAVSEDTLGPQRGPAKKEAHNTTHSNRKYQWGLPAVHARHPSDYQDDKRGPFKLEELKLQMRKQES